jgi:hypothetical protein
MRLTETHGSVHFRNDRWPSTARSVLCVAVYYVFVRSRRCQGSACGWAPLEHGNRMHSTSLSIIGGRPTRQPHLDAASRRGEYVESINMSTTLLVKLIATRSTIATILDAKTAQRLNIEKEPSVRELAHATSGQR